MLSIYIHFPFCNIKCPYCDFYSLARSFDDEDALFNAYKRDLHDNFIPGKTISTIFFGGGTPSLMSENLIYRILDLISSLYSLSKDIEITLECNPREHTLLKNFKNAGINRISIGIQSLVDKNLLFLKRNHSSADSLNAIDSAINTFENFSFDFIYALPGQSVSEWESELCQIMSFDPKHLSLYQLTIEEGTVFHKTNVIVPEEGKSLEFFDITNSISLDSYEISNHSKKGFEAKHNLVYWKYLDYIGIGPSAHGRYSKENQKISTQYPRNFESWIKNGDLIKEEIDKKIVLQEKLMMGLRLTEGINLDNELNIDLNPLINEGYALMESKKLRLTYEGRKRHSAIMKWIFEKINETGASDRFRTDDPQNHNLVL